MGRRHALVVAALGFVACGIACVDLFHSTDFDTLCTVSPTDPRCGSDAANKLDVGSEEDARPAPRPPPDFCLWSTEQAKREAAHACAWLGACEGPLKESKFGPCMVRAQLAFDCNANPTLRPGGVTKDFWSCLATVQSCADVDACAFPAAAPDRCVAVEAGSFDGCGNGNPSTLLQCTQPGLGRPSGLNPCPMLGKTCTTDGKSSASCTGTPGDQAKDALVCAATECRGTVARFCTSTTLDDGFDCASQSAKCVTVAGVPACRPSSGPICSGGGTPTCDGAKIGACVNGHLAIVDCSKIGPVGADGFACDATQLTGSKTYDITEACTLTTPTCTADEDSCAGTTLKSCGRGASYEVDCVTAGLNGGCKLIGTAAACVP